ncbi:hypothetical protein WMY93_031351 [Mugilogobius chulae]|uniref:protein disulfide-isomerase n=1 Tax=Mugilogobius chulae TaxID=88201 RepID=A0AAW0MFT8_9GOBI
MLLSARCPRLCARYSAGKSPVRPVVRLGSASAMAPLFLHLAFFLLVSFPAAGAARRDVLELADADFDYLATEHETMLVKFYAPWCGHCKKLAPDFEKAATKLKGTVQLAKVDCTANSDLCSRFGVTGYPTLKIFRNGRDAGAYDGPRSEGLVQVMKNSLDLTRSAQVQVDLDQFVQHYEASIVGLFSSDSSRLSEFLKAAGLLREQFRFAHSLDVSLGSEFNASGECVLLFRPPRLANKFEESVVVFSDYLTITSLRRFIRDNMVMLVASKFRGRGLSFSVANRRDFEAELQEEFGLGPDSGELPVATIRTRLGLKYSMREEFTRDGRSLERFLEDYFSGRLKRFIKSEPVPEKTQDLSSFPTIYFAAVGRKDEPIRYEGHAK